MCVYFKSNHLFGIFHCLFHDLQFKVWLENTAVFCICYTLRIIIIFLFVILRKSDSVLDPRLLVCPACPGSPGLQAGVRQ